MATYSVIGVRMMLTQIAVLHHRQQMHGITGLQPSFIVGMSYIPLCIVHLQPSFIVGMSYIPLCIVAYTA